MAAKAEDPIAGSDIDEFLLKTSDFRFELSVLDRLNELGFRCDHAGTFQDPVTDKIRSYDFRARKKVAERHELYLAVECKNIRPASPLLVYATPRTAEESFHTLIRHQRNPHFHIPADAVPIRRPNRAYPEGEGVGRETDQPKRIKGELVGNDAQTFEKLSQALNSTHDLVIEAEGKSGPAPVLIAVAPIVAIPDGLLWQVDYSNDGKLLKTPRQVESTTLICRHRWKIPERPMNSMRDFTISHLEIITFSALANRLNQLAGDQGYFGETGDLLTH